ncbi:MAG: PaaI family thioesterase [Pseudomonadota bacterium]
MEHPFASLIGLEVDDAEEGASVCSLVIDPASHHNPHGVTHGAVLYALADTGMGAAVYTRLGAGQTCATVEIKFNYFRSVRQGKVRCETAIVNLGRTIASLESRLYADGELVASANGSYAIRNANGRDQGA